MRTFINKKGGYPPVTLAVALAVALLLQACSPSPQPIHFGQEECSHCSMIISEEPFASQLLTETGRHYNFDAIECLAAYVEGGEVDEDHIHSLLVPDFNRPDEWLDAREAVILKSENLQSPMGLNYSAYAGDEQAREHKQGYGGELLDWMQVRNEVRKAWIE